MIYCDTAYLLKYYVGEPGSDEVRGLIDSQVAVASLGLARLELAAAFHRKLREAQIDKRAHRLLIQQFESDCHSGIWTWLDSGAALVEKAAARYTSLSARVFLRASDALHLTCALENGFREIYSNDTHLLAAAKHFGLRGKNIITPRPQKQ
jgi:predicted nucleic acid-binding protein